MSNHDHEPGSVDWLDLGPDPDEGRTPPDPRRRYLWYGGTAALVAVALLLTQTQHGTNRAATSPRSPSGTVSSGQAASDPAASSAASSSQAASSQAASHQASSGSFVDPPPIVVTAPSGGASAGLTSAPRLGPPKVTSLGHPLLDVPADWELFAQGPNVVIRIELARGRITTTPVPVSRSDAPVVLLAGSDRVLVRTMDGTTGYVIRDGKAATELPPSLQQTMWMFPGPDQQHLWVDRPHSGLDGLALLTLGGRPTGVTIDVPSRASVLGSDGAGFVLLSGIGGIYDAQPGIIRRITSGVLLAAGPTRWLTIECDDSLSCARMAVDRATRARRPVHHPSAESDDQNGMISPDGKTEALLVPSDGVSANRIDLVDLDSGADLAVDVVPSSTAPLMQLGPQVVWSPDSRWLFVPDDNGRVMIVNRATGRATPLGTRLPPVDRLALRHGAS